MTDSLERTYEDLSRTAVFLEQTRRDELLYENIYGTSMHGQIESIEQRYMYPLLCHLETAMFTHGGSTKTLIEREIMPDSIRDLSNRSLRHNRDYIVLRELEKVLWYVSTEYSLLHSHHSALSSGAW